MAVSRSLTADEFAQHLATWKREVATDPHHTYALGMMIDAYEALLARTEELTHENEQFEEVADLMLDALLLIQDRAGSPDDTIGTLDHGWCAGVASSAVAAIAERATKWKAQESHVPRFLPTWLGGQADRVDGAAPAGSSPAADPREQQVRAFADLMLRELHANERKDRHPLSHDRAHLLDQLREHVEKFAAEPTEEHAADVGNLAMLALGADSEPTCKCPAGSYDWPNAVHESYCPLAGSSPAAEAETDWPTEGLPLELAKLLRDPRILIPQDAEAFELIAKDYIENRTQQDAPTTSRVRLCDIDGIVRKGFAFHYGDDYPCTGSAHFAGLTLHCTNPIHTQHPGWVGGVSDSSEAEDETDERANCNGSTTCPARRHWAVCARYSLNQMIEDERPGSSVTEEDA